MTVSTVLIAAAIIAQPMLLIGIVIGFHARDRRAA
jgi:hypothetical protein